MFIRKWDRQAIEAILPEVIKEVHCHSASDETKRYQLLSLQGFLLKFYLEVCEKLMRKQVDVHFASLSKHATD